MSSIQDILYFMSKCVNFVNSYFKSNQKKSSSLQCFESSRDQLQDSAIKNDFHLKKLMQPWLDFSDIIQDQTNKISK